MHFDRIAAVSWLVLEPVSGCSFTMFLLQPMFKSQNTLLTSESVSSSKFFTTKALVSLSNISLSVPVEKLELFPLSEEPPAVCCHRCKRVPPSPPCETRRCEYIRGRDPPAFPALIMAASMLGQTLAELTCSQTSSG